MPQTAGEGSSDGRTVVRPYMASLTSVYIMFSMTLSELVVVDVVVSSDKQIQQLCGALARHSSVFMSL